MAEYETHRLRVGDWMPSSKIKSIACDAYSSLVAVGREDGDIEVIVEGTVDNNQSFTRCLDCKFISEMVHAIHDTWTI